MPSWADTTPPARAEAERSGAEAKEALWQAEATRKARGRLRRAWDGWRGR